MRTVIVHLTVLDSKRPTADQQPWLQQQLTMCARNLQHPSVKLGLMHEAVWCVECMGAIQQTCM